MTAARQPQIACLPKPRFDALAGYTRRPFILLLMEEVEWLATSDERVLGIVIRDRIDHDFGWVAMCRDERLRFQAVAVNASLLRQDIAREQLCERMRGVATEPDTKFYQADAGGAPVDFLTPIVPDHRFHSTFRMLTSEER